MLKNKKGFTLIELLAVIVILAVIATISVVAVSGTLKKSKTNLSKVDEKSIKDAFTLFLSENNCDEKNSNAVVVGVDANNTNKWSKCQIRVTDLIANGYLEVDDATKYTDKFVITQIAPLEAKTIVVDKCASLNGKTDDSNCPPDGASLNTLCDLNDDQTTDSDDFANMKKFAKNDFSDEIVSINPYLLELIVNKYKTCINYSPNSEITLSTASCNDTALNKCS